MTYIKLVHAGLLGASCLALGGCLGSSNGGGLGGGGGSAGSVAEYDTKFSELTANTSGLAPTSKELTGSATFSGSTKIQLFEAANASNTGEAIGDLALQADFDTETISGTATNFRGTLNGEDVALTGTLDTANGLAPSSLLEVTSPIILPPGVPAIPNAPTSVTANSFSVYMGGELSDDDGVIGNVNLGMLGVFVGPIGGSEATAAYGPSTVVVSDVTGTAGLIDIGGAGTFYIEKD